MIGKFKEKIFEVKPDRIYTFSSFSTELKLNHEEQEVEGAKSKIYVKSPGLETFNIELNLNGELGVDVRKELNDWKKYLNESAVDYIYIGDEKYGDKWIIISLSTSDCFYFGDRILTANLKIAFKEFPGFGKKKEEKVKEKKKRLSKKL